MAAKRSKTRLVSALAIVALGSIIFGWNSATPAGGIETSVSLTYGGTDFTGRVTAAPPCQASRDIVIVRHRHKRPRNVIIGFTKTNPDGTFRFQRKFARGKFLARALTSNVPSTGYAGYSSTILCEEGNSPFTKVDRRRRHPRRR